MSKFVILLTGGPVQSSASHQVNVQMEHGLSGARPDIDYRAVSVFNAAPAGDLGGYQLAAAQGLGIIWFSLFQTANVFFGNHEDVSGCLRVNVFKGVTIIVFVDLLSGHFATDDAAEQAILHGSHFGSSCPERPSLGEITSVNSVLRTGGKLHRILLGAVRGKSLLRHVEQYWKPRSTVTGFQGPYV
jgi:hypothetical protein